MTVPALLAALPEVTPGGKLIMAFWSIWGIAMFIGFLVKAFRTDDLEIVPVAQKADHHPSH